MTIPAFLRFDPPDGEQFGAAADAVGMMLDRSSYGNSVLAWIIAVVVVLVLLLALEALGF